MFTSEPTDAELVRAAQAGDAGGLGLLLTRHQAPMRVTALGVLGHHPDVDDAVQEAGLIAVRRICDLREPAAVGGWLRTIVRNQSRAQLRARTATPMADLDLMIPAADDLDPARLLEQHALGNWIWHAVNTLSPELRLVTMLRYFSSAAGYEQIATVCDIPIGTVRSRLSQARARLGQALTAGADRAHGDQQALTQARYQQAKHTLEAARTGEYGPALAEVCTPDLDMVWGRGKRTHGLAYPIAAMYRDVGDGVDFRLADVVAGHDVLIWETELISPPDDPFHCPPTAVWVHFLQPGPGGRASRARVFHPATK